MMNKIYDPVEKVNNLIKKSVTLKLLTITLLMLLLLIPAVLIEEIVLDRKQMNLEAMHEVTSKWGLEQQLTGPVLTIPFTYQFEDNGVMTVTTRYWHILPQHLDIEGSVVPEKLKRGIYDVIVYQAALTVSGAFMLTQQPDPEYLKQIHSDKAFLTIGLSDLRGIKKEVMINWDQQKLHARSGTLIPELIYSGITIQLPEYSAQIDQEINFDFTLDLRGSNSILFVPVGNTTQVQLSSPWKSPSFDGNFLPEKRSLSTNGFQASWSVLQLNRNFPQTWTGNVVGKQLDESAFGVNLITPVDDYQKSYRSVRYAIMPIALTFLIFFLAEIINKIRIHPFQYALVGLTLCLFYILLVTISEHTTFNMAYGLSTLAVVLMITLYSQSVFVRSKLTSLLVLLLTVIYGFLFATLQMEDYAMLMGSIGLTCILGLTMYFTRNVDWYHMKTDVADRN